MPASPQPPAIVNLTLLGEPAWACAGGPRVVLTDKDAALLAILALDGPQSRAHLCALLWPDAAPGKAATSLRQRTHRLQRAAGQAVIETGDRLRLASRTISDVAALATLGAEQLMACGELLAGVDLGELDELDRWLARARKRVDQTRADGLAHHAEALQRRGELHAALALASRIVELTPLAEHAWRRLMRLHYLRNDRGAAMAVFERMEGHLLLELGAQPSAETMQLWQTITSSGQAQPLPSRPVPASVMLPPVLVGRTAAWRAMAAAWQQARPFVLVGDAGMGKSRLLDEFVRGRGGVVTDKARRGDERTPYAVLGRTLVAIEQRHAPRVPESARRELARIRPEFGVPWPAKARSDVVWNALEQYLAAAVESGLEAIVFDDVHAADLASLEALRWLSGSPRLAGLRLALATRPPREPPTAQWLAQWLDDSQPPVRVDLAPLSLQDLGALLASLALPALVDPAITEHLYRHAGGHPLYTLATLQDALTHGIDLRRTQLPHPPSVQALLDARLHELPAATLGLLRVSAVAGADLTVERAATLLGCKPLDLTEPWSTLEAANVLRGESFTHDLLHEAALRSVPLGLRAALHRQLAALLAGDAQGAAGRVAWHWEQGERWAEAGRCWHAAGIAARQAGRLAEQAELFEHAARCHQRAGDDGARFEALFARLDGLLLRHGGTAVLAALPEAEALADTSARRLRCSLARAEAWLDDQKAEQAAAEAAAAVQQAARHPELQADASALHAIALVQRGRFAAALEAAQQAMAGAAAADSAAQRLRATNALAYVHYASGHLAEAVPVQRDAVVLAETIGDRAEAAATEGHVAALLASVGDVPATYTHALRARERHLAIGLADNSTLGTVNHIVLGTAAAYLGRFDEGLDALQAAVAMASSGAATAAQAKARLALGNLWLTLGRADAARTLAAELPADMPPGMHMQAALLLARAAALEGLPQQRHWQTLARWAADHPDLPLVQSAWYEVSHQGDAGPVITRLAQVRAECTALGLHGTARALQFRQLARCLDLEGEAATVAARTHAHALMPHVERGLSAKCYPPQVWLTLAAAFGRAGEPASHAECISAGRRWVAGALARVPAEHRQRFERGNPANRQLLGAAPAGG
jgi:DNA-binding SARP family transcriptional activator